MNVTFILGMAGTGKSSLTGALRDWLRLREINVLALNLDPGALSLPYDPDVDVRSMINVYQLMEKYQLGPNGALIMAADLIADHLEEVVAIVEELEPEFLLVDTPGQIELFAFRESGPFIVNNMPGEKAVVYLLDAPFSRNPLNFVSNLFLAVAVYHRLLKPQIYALSKSDMITQSEVEKMISWTLDFEELSHDLESKAPAQSLVMRELAEALERTGLITEPIPTSSKNMEGFTELSAAITRVLARGEEASN
ncbi:MAG: ATP/GTP-binding protein [Candidatus Bathyarchaeia archaeon]|nr:ATP/GTP-binding protein [Candidatus Bathyarchaeota archaeon]